MSQQSQWKQWQLEGNTTENYEKYLVPALFAPWAAKLLDHAALAAEERVLDIACGTGIVARLAAQRVADVGQIVGLDMNQGMLEIARKSSTEITTPIEWKEGSVLDIPFPDAVFDVVTCQAGLMYFAEQQAIQEIHRVLIPGGRFVVSVWRPIQYNRLYAALVDALGRHISDEAAAIMKGPFSLGEFDQLRNLITSGGFENVHIRLESEILRFESAAELVWQQAVSSPLSTPFSQVNDTVRAALIEDFSSAMKQYFDDDGLAYPMEAYIAIAFKNSD